MRHRVIGVLAGFALLLATAGTAFADREGVPVGQLAGPDEEILPLLGTDVTADITGTAARVTVRQLFENGLRQPIEAVYSFPLPDRAGVDDVTVQIGARTVRSELLSRDEATARYAGALLAGKTAALTAQVRPNLFTQKIANILPNERILVELTYTEDLRREDGVTTFVFPVVAAPRYAAPAGLEAGDHLPPGELPRDRLSLTARIDAGFPILDLGSESHRIDVYHDGGPVAEVSIHPADSLPVKDFVLTWRTESEDPDAAVLAHRAGADGTFCLTIQPEETAREAYRIPREVIFVVDSSGSMEGMPIETAKRVTAALLRTLGPDDLFQVLKFADGADSFAEASVPATRHNIVSGLNYVDRMKGDGGTEFLSGLRLALDTPEDPYRMRMVLFLTDGLIGNEQTVLTELRERLGDGRAFSLGIGSAPNRFFLDRLAEVGHGAARYIRQDASPEKIDQEVARFLDRIRSPVLHRLEIDWGGLRVRTLEPHRFPDLFAGQQIRIYGRYDGETRGTITIRGLRGHETFERSIFVALPEFERANSILPKLWARERIRRLMLSEYAGEQADVSEEVTALALENRLLTRYTAFVAVDERVVTDGTKTRRVEQKAAWPEGVGSDYFGIMVQAPRRRSVPAAAPSKAPPKPYVPGATRPTFPNGNAVPDLHLAFLRSWQEEDGSWAAGGDLLGSTGATALALLAMDASGKTAGEGPYGRSVQRGYAWLARRQARDGHFGGEDSPNPLLDHALATISWLDGCERAGWKSGWSRAKRAVAYLVSRRIPELGWARDGGPEGSDTLATSLAVFALDRARRAGMKVGDDVFFGALAHLEAVTDRDTGLVSMDLAPPDRADGHAIAAAILTRLALGAEAKDAHYIRDGARALLDLPAPIGENADPLFLFLATAALKRVGGEEFAAWDPPLNEQIRKGMIPSEKEDEEGDPRLVGPPGARLGRAAAIALFGMARGIYEPASHPFPLK